MLTSTGITLFGMEVWVDTALPQDGFYFLRGQAQVFQRGRDETPGYCSSCGSHRSLHRGNGWPKGSPEWCPPAPGEVTPNAWKAWCEHIADAILTPKTEVPEKK